MVATVAVPTPESLHRRALAAPIAEVAGLLQGLLTRRLAAYVAGVKDGKTVARWASGEIADVRETAVEQRLRTAYEIALLLLELEAPATVRAWFIGLDPLLDDRSPAEAIHDGELKAAIEAARAFAANG